MMNSPMSYPDVLGTITGGARQNIGVIQAALAIHPFAVRAGHPFEVIILLQNASDVEVDLTLTLRLPEVDYEGTKDCFVAKRQRIGVDLQPGQVGCAILPVTCLAKTTPGSHYTLSVELSQRPKSAPTRVRPAEGSDPVDLSILDEDVQSFVGELRRMRFAVDAKRNLRSKLIEAQFNVMPGGISQALELQPRWQSIWTQSAQGSEPFLAFKYRDDLRDVLLPALKRTRLTDPLWQQTEQRFKAAGITLEHSEIKAITRMLVLILEYAGADRNGHSPIAAGTYNLMPLAREGVIPEVEELPHWFRQFIHLMDRAPRIAKFPERIIPTHCYLPLLRDAIHYGFRVVETASGEDLGTSEEMTAYSQHVVDFLENPNGKNPLNMAQVYMPLVIAGGVLADKLVLPNEKTDGVLVSLMYTLYERRRDRPTKSEAETYILAEQLLERVMTKYNGLEWSG